MQNPFSLENKTILVTGASSGLGRATAKILMDQGARLIMVGRNKERLMETLSHSDNPGDHCVEVFDFADVEAIPEWLKNVTSRWGGPINGLAHFAGIHETTPLRVLSYSMIDKIMKINVSSALALLKCCTNKKICAVGSSLVLVSSVVGQVGQPGVVTYSASKGAVISMAKSAALELARQNIRVNALIPGMVKTEMFDKLVSQTPDEQYHKNLNYHPLGFGEPKDVGYAVNYLLSDAAKWVTGTAMVVDGGYTCH